MSCKRFTIARFVLLFMVLISSTVFANSSQEVLKERILLLQKQYAQLEPQLISIDSKEPLTLKILNESYDALNIKKDVFTLKLTLATSEQGSFLHRQQQANKKLSSINGQAPFKTIHASIKHNDEMSQQSSLEILWLKKNIELVNLLLVNNENQKKKLELKNIQLERKDITEKLKAKIKRLRTQNYELLKNRTGELALVQDGMIPSVLLESQRILNDLTVSLRRLEIEKLQLTIKLNYSDYLRVRSADLVMLQQLMVKLNELGTRIDLAKKVFENIATTQKELGKYWIKTVLDNKNLNSLNALLRIQKSNTSVLYEEYNQLGQRVKERLADYESESFEILKLRKGLLKDTLSQGRQIVNEFIKLPQASLVYIYGLYGRISEFSTMLSPWLQFLYGGILSLMLIFWFVGKRYHNDFLNNQKSYPNGHHFYLILNSLLSKNWSALCLLGILFFIFTAANIPPISYQLILVIFSVWFVFRTIISITRLGLLETLSNVKGHDVVLYHRLRLTFILGGIVTLVMVFSHYLHMHYLVLELLDRLFMIFLFSVSIVLLRGHRVLLILIHNYLNPQKFYTKRALDLLTLLIPFSLLVNGAIGVLGYVSLAWNMGAYQAIIVLAVIFYVILRGILLDSLDKISQKMIVNMNNGWLWTEALLKPFYNILLYLLFIVLVVMVFRLYGWDNNSQVVKGLYDLWHLNLLSVSRILITTQSLVLFIILVMLLTWTARWSREFCYRWLYHNVIDQGLRNSISIFTQYAIVTLGSIVTLTVLGIDISGISMIIGGLAVGVGFGLRDFANNIVGGIVLLIERPVKEGDLVSFGELEGKVTHIGLRSTRIESWDNYEVVLPNSDLFIKPFTNWTHKNPVVRTVVGIKVNRYDSPLKVQKLVLDVLHIIPELLKEPAPEVFLINIDDPLVELEVRYYINVEKYSRVEVRSNVLFAIMAQFKAAGIRSPIKNLQVEYVNNDSC